MWPTNEVAGLLYCMTMVTYEEGYDEIKDDRKKARVNVKEERSPVPSLAKANKYCDARWRKTTQTSLTCDAPLVCTGA
jgi:hypothetical protein